jgi:hypothetical protein
MMPPDPQLPAAAQAETSPVTPPPTYRWYQKVSAVVFITFCLEIGMYLLIVPWTESWDGNYFSGLPRMKIYWDNLYLRGAVSGLGAVNLLISLSEIFRLRRFARR